MQRGQWVDPMLGLMKLEDWAATFLRTSHDIDESTRAAYKRDLERYVLPRFGGVPMSRLRNSLSTSMSRAALRLRSATISILIGGLPDFGTASRWRIAAISATEARLLRNLMLPEASI